MLSPVFLLRWYMQLKDVFTFENLYKSYLKCRKGKRNKLEVIKYEINIVENLLSIEKNFKNGVYPNVKYYEFVIHQHKTRVIKATSFENRIIQACLCDYYLYDLLKPYYIEQSSAVQKGKGTWHAIKLVKKHMIDMLKETGSIDYYCLKCDIKQYFASVDKEVLKKILLKDFVKDELLDFIIYIIDSNKDDGLPLGNRSSQLLALYYLSSLDNLVTKQYHIQYYSRYADDFIVFSNNKIELINLLKDIQILMNNKLHLELNNKTAIFPIKNSLSYLGLKFFHGCNNRVIVSLRKERKPMIRKKFKSLLIEKNYQGIISIFGHLKHINAYNFCNNLLSYDKNLTLAINDVLQKLNT